MLPCRNRGKGSARTSSSLWMGERETAARPKPRRWQDGFRLRIRVIPGAGIAAAPAEGRPAGPGAEAATDERMRIVRALEQCAGSQAAAARLLGISRGTLIARIEAYGLQRPRTRREPR